VEYCEKQCKWRTWCCIKKNPDMDYMIMGFLDGWAPPSWELHTRFCVQGNANVDLEALLQGIPKMEARMSWANPSSGTFQIHCASLKFIQEWIWIPTFSIDYWMDKILSIFRITRRVPTFFFYPKKGESKRWQTWIAGILYWHLLGNTPRISTVHFSQTDHSIVWLVNHNCSTCCIG
jgi:hypothetical protein